MTKGFVYDGHLFYADLSLVSLESHYRLFSKDSYEEIVEPEDIFHARSFRLILEDYINSLIAQDAELYPGGPDDPRTSGFDTPLEESSAWRFLRTHECRLAYGTSHIPLLFQQTPKRVGPPQNAFSRVTA